MSALAGLVLAAVMAPEPPILVEVSSVEGDVAVTPRDLVALEDALALAFTTDALRVETKRQRAARIPAAVSLHAEELNACADPGWPKARVLACVESLSFPAVTSRPARFRKITHVLRMARRRDRDGETLALSLSTVGRQGDEQVLKQKLPRNAPPEERRAAVVEMAGLLLSGLSPRPEAGTRPR